MRHSRRTLLTLLALCLLKPATSTNYPTHIDRCLNPKQIHLTFDDGPSTFTPRLLDILSSLSVPATFFITGSMAAQSPEYIKRAITEGHTIGSHTYTHINAAETSLETFKEELARTDSVLGSILGQENYSAKYFRYPYGAYSDITDGYLKEIGKVPVFWNVDTNDWALYNTWADGIIEEFDNKVSEQDPSSGVIVLLHDTYSESIERVTKMVEWARGQGFSFVSMEECVGGGVVNTGLGKGRIEIKNGKDGAVSSNKNTTAKSEAVGKVIGNGYLGVVMAVLVGVVGSLVMS